MVALLTKKYCEHDSSPHKNTMIMVATCPRFVTEIQLHPRQLREFLSWRLRYIFLICVCAYARAYVWGFCISAASWESFSASGRGKI